MLTSIILLLGFLREYLFANINWIFLTLTNGRKNAARNEFQFLMDWEISKIIVLKWILTFLFSFLFFLITYFIVKIYFQKKEFNHTVIYTFVGLFIISSILFTIGEIFGVYEILYSIIRTIMGMVQSFMPLMILFVLFKFLPPSKYN